jgi:hypothetical protein
MNQARSNLAASLLLALALLAGCGSSATATRPATVPPANTQRSGSHPHAGSAGAACRSRGRSVCATAASNGHTVSVGVGWTIEVVLRGSSGIWSAPVETGQRLLSQLGGARREGGGVSVAYRTVGAGKTGLRAFARPLCRPRRVCPQFILTWQLHVRVSR